MGESLLKLIVDVELNSVDYKTSFGSEETVETQYPVVSSIPFLWSIILYVQVYENLSLNLPISLVIWTGIRFRYSLLSTTLVQRYGIPDAPPQ